MNPLCFKAADESDTQRLGRALARVLPEPAVVALDGTLGAGKTRLVQALAAALEVDPRIVVSPTFVLVQQYQGARDIYHVDAYRLRDDDEFWQLGLDERFDDPAAVVIVEWAERVAASLPAERLIVEIAVTGVTARSFTLSALGPRHAAALAALAPLLQP